MYKKEKKAPEEYKTRSLEGHPVIDKKNGAVRLDWGAGEKMDERRGRLVRKRERVRERAGEGGGDREIGMGEKLRGGFFSLSHRGSHRYTSKKKRSFDSPSNIYSLINFQYSIAIYRKGSRCGCSRIASSP